MESIIKEDIEKHISQQNIIHPRQHGFCRGRSTASNLIEFWDEVTEAAENKQSLSIIYTDLRKAFDSVSHRLLITKLARYGIGNKTLRWLKNFLEDRVQQVSVKGITSAPKPVKSGVPQGGGVLSGIYFPCSSMTFLKCLATAKYLYTQMMPKFMPL